MVDGKEANASCKCRRPSSLKHLVFMSKGTQVLRLLSSDISQTGKKNLGGGGGGGGMTL